MNYVKVKSFEHLRELLESGEREFITCTGVLRHSYYFDLDGEDMYEMDYCDGSEYECTWQEFVNDYGFDKDIACGRLFCETNREYNENS